MGKLGGKGKIRRKMKKKEIEIGKMEKIGKIGKIWK